MEDSKMPGFTILRYFGYFLISIVVRSIRLQDYRDSGQQGHRVWVSGIFGNGFIYKNSTVIMVFIKSLAFYFFSWLRRISRKMLVSKR